MSQHICVVVSPLVYIFYIKSVYQVIKTRLFFLQNKLLGDVTLAESRVPWKSKKEEFRLFTLHPAAVNCERFQMGDQNSSGSKESNESSDRPRFVLKSNWFISGLK